MYDASTTYDEFRGQVPPEKATKQTPTMSTTEAITTEPQPAQTMPAKRKGGAPLGSSNARRHGLRMSKLPPGVPHIGRDLNQLRKALEAAEANARGSVSVSAAATINRAVRFERKLRLVERHLAENAAMMTPETYLAFERESARWLLDRDRAIDDLDLTDHRLPSLWPIGEGAA